MTIHRDPLPVVVEGITLLAGRGSRVVWEQRPDGEWECTVSTTRMRRGITSTRTVAREYGRTGHEAARRVLEEMWGRRSRR